MYFNEVYFGNGAWGIVHAARFSILTSIRMN